MTEWTIQSNTLGRDPPGVVSGLRMRRLNDRVSIGQINTQSLFAKRDRLECYLANTCMDVILVSEVWMRNKTFRMKGYRFLYKQREFGHGGVAILTKNHIVTEDSINLPFFEFIEVVATRTKNLVRNLWLVSVYITQSRNEGDRAKVLRDIKKLFEWMRGKSDMIVGGDMNAHHSMWGGWRNDARGNLLADLVQTSDFVILNDGRPTRRGAVGQRPSALDLSIVSIGLGTQVTWNVTEEDLGGDHYMIEMNVGRNAILKVKKLIMNEKKWVGCMNEILSKGEVNDIDQLECEIERVNEICSRNVDMKEIRVNEWWNNEIQYWYERKRIALRQFNGCICRDHQIAYSRLNAKMKKAIRKAKRKSWREYVSSMTHRTTTKNVWNMFNRVKGVTTSNARNIVMNEREKGDEFLRMMMDVENSLNDVTIRENLNDRRDRMIGDYDREEFLGVLKRSKSTTPGTNRVSYRMIENLNWEAQQNLLALLNKVWMGNGIPEKWKECRVVPIPKRDRDLSLATNYRGIWMLNVLLKIVNGMLKERIERFMEENNLLPNTTFGFRKGHSANECVEKFVWEVYKDNMKVVAVFLDIERAYDYVVPQKLIQILVDLGFPKRICDWVYMFMSERRMILNGRDYRLEGLVDIGLPQGSKISPMLFNLYTSGIHQLNSQNKIILQFADDFVIIGKGRRLEDARERAQEGVNQYMQYVSDLNLRVNVSKCAWMGIKTYAREIEIKIGNERVERVNVYKYLGIWIDRRMNFNKHMCELADNCKKRLNVIKRVSKPKWGASPSVTDTLRKALVSSKIAYGISVYGNGAKGGFERLMRVENACARVVLGAITSTPIQTLWSEMGDSPLNYKREWITVRETVRMLIRGNEFLKEVMWRLQSSTVVRQTYRATIILENINIFSRIPKIGTTNKPSNLQVCLKFGDTSKNEMNEITAKKVFVEMRMKYLTYLDVYTDASVNDRKVGVGVYIPGMNVENVSSVDESICIMNAELIGMLEGLKLALNGERRRIVIFSDSKSGLTLIDQGRGTQGSVYVDKIYELVRSCSREVVFQWIPSHKQIAGNEKADMLAKLGCVTERMIEYEVVDARDVLRMFKANLWSKWVNEYSEMSRLKGKKYSELCNTPLRKPFYKEIKGDTRMIRTIERIRLNHGNWKECLYKRRLSDNSLCDVCMVVEDIEHLILTCPRYDHIRSQYNVLSGERNLTEIMRMGGDAYKNMYEFIRMSGIIV